MEQYSYSKISSFETCPKQFQFNYILREERDFDNTAENILGSSVHTVLENLYKKVKIGLIPQLDELLLYFEKVWSEKWTGNIKIVREGLTEETYKKKGIEFIKNYHSRHKPFNNSKIIGTEIKINIPMDENSFLIGFIDRLDCIGTKYFIHDYKTSSNLLTQEQADADRQLAIYSMAVKKMFPDAEQIKLIWHYLAFDKKIESERTDEELTKLKQEIIQKIQAIRNTREFPTKKTALCDWCAFKSKCPAWGFEQNFSGNTKNSNEELDKNEYSRTKTNIQETVNKIETLVNQKKKLNTELEELKEKLIEYSIEQEVDEIQGTNKNAKIRKNILYNVKETEKQLLFNLLSKKGIAFEIYHANTLSLTKAVNDGKISDAEKKLLEEKENYKVLLSKKK